MVRFLLAYMLLMGCVLWRIHASKPYRGEGSSYYPRSEAIRSRCVDLDCCLELRDEIDQLAHDVERMKTGSGCAEEKGSQRNPARSCRELRQTGLTESRPYWIQPDPDVYPFPIQVFCEMEFEGGGWVRVFNMMAKPMVTGSAVEMYNIITRNADARVVLSNSTSTAVFSKGLRLQEYTQAVFGWAPSADSRVMTYGLMTRNEGLRNVCYLDGFCGDNQDIGRFRSSVTGHERTFKSGYSASAAHVGIGYHSQVVVWGYDSNNVANQATAGTFYSHWGNWNDSLSTSSGSPCCNGGATVDLLQPTSLWRYSILIR